MEITFTENAHNAIATVRLDEVLTLWSRQSPHDWDFLGSLADDGRSLDTTIRSQDLPHLASVLDELDDAFDLYAEERY